MLQPIEFDMTIDTIYHGDCLEYLRSLPDACVDLVVTDPPYLIETSGGGLYTKHSKRYVKELSEIKDGFDSAVLDELCRVMKHVNAYFFCSQRQIPILLDYFVKGRGCFWNILSWHKSNPVPACCNKYLTDTEYIMFFREKGVKLYGSFETKRTWYLTPYNKADKDRYHHPTIKPLEIVCNLITNSSLEGEVVLDPFVGSGTTAVASKRLGRHFLGAELNLEYAEIAERRLAEENTRIGESLESIFE